MLIALEIYTVTAVIYFIGTVINLKVIAMKRKKMFPHNKHLYTINYKELIAQAIFFPYDIVRKIITI